MSTSTSTIHHENKPKTTTKHNSKVQLMNKLKNLTMHCSSSTNIFFQKIPKELLKKNNPIKTMSRVGKKASSTVNHLVPHGLITENCPKHQLPLSSYKSIFLFFLTRDTKMMMDLNLTKK